MSKKTNLCCVKQHKAGRGQTGHGSHHCCSQGHCTPCLRMACRQRERLYDQSTYSAFAFIHSFHSWRLTYQYIQISSHKYLLLCACVRVAAAVFSSSVMFCSVSSGTLHFSITTISISVFTQKHSLYLLASTISIYKGEVFILHNIIHIHITPQQNTHTHTTATKKNGILSPVITNL